MAVTVVSFGGFVPRLSHCLTTIVPLVGGRPIRLKKMEPREWMKKIREIRLTGLNGTHEKITCIDEQVNNALAFILSWFYLYYYDYSTGEALAVVVIFT